MIFQAGLTVIEKKFIEEPEYDEPEPLRMEHFHLPLGMWFVGILISLFCFLAEIIINWINIRKSNKLRAGRLSDTEEAEGTQVQDIEDTED